MNYFQLQANEEPTTNTCFPPIAFFVPEFDCDNNNYMLTIGIFDLGTADSLALVLNGDTLASGIQLGTQVGPFDIPSALTFTLVHNQDTTCNVSGTLTFDNCPPVNDFCFSSEIVPDIPIDGVNCATINGTLVNATGTAIPISCAAPGQEHFDVFYEFTATANSLTFEQTGGTGTPVKMLILDSCFDGEEIEGTCQDLSERVVINNLEIDETYTLMIWQTAATPDLQLGDFEICIRQTPPPINDVCTNAIPIVPAIGQVNAIGCMPDTLFFTTDGTTDSGMDASCAGNNTGLDQFFTWTATKPGLLWNGLTPSLPSIAIYENAGTPENPQCGNEIICANAIAFQDIELNGWEIGDHLIIQIFDLGTSVADVSYCLREVVTCTQPVADFIPKFDCDNNNYTLEVRVTDLGDADSLALVLDGDTLASGIQLDTVEVGPFSIPSTLTFTLVHNQDSVCHLSETLTFDNCPPPNDLCIFPETIPAIPTDGFTCATINGTLINANNEGIIPSCDLPGRDRFDVFYTFTATATNLTLEQTGGTGSTVNILVLEACGGAQVTGTCRSLRNKVGISGLEVGREYILMVWQSTAIAGLQLGDFEICIRKTPEAPVNGDCANALPFPAIPIDGTCASVAGTMESATSSETNGISCLSGDGFPDVFYTFTATTTAIRLEETLGRYEMSFLRLALFDVCDGTEIPGSCSTFPTTIKGLTVGTSYILKLVSQVQFEPFEICIKAAANIPANDDCENAIAFPAIPDSGAPVTISGTTDNATAPIEPPSCDELNPKDVFYTFVANNPTLFFESTLGTASFMQFEIYEANDNCDGAVLANSCNGFPKFVEGFEVGTTYVLRVWTRFVNPTGTFDLSIRKVNRPPNDDCANAIAFPNIPTDGTPATVFGDTEFALASGSPTECDNISGRDDLFYTFDATTTDIQFEALLGTTDNVFMEVLESCGEAAITNSCGELPRIVSGLNIGTTYILRVWNINRGGQFLGSFNLNAIAIPDPPANDECANAIALPVNTRFGCKIRTAGTNASATASPQVDDATGTPNNDVWYRFEAIHDEHFVVLFDVKAKIGTSNNMAIAVYDGTNGCDNLTFVDDANGNFLTLSNLTVGNTYFVRVYGFDATNSAQTNFDICIDTPLCGAIIFEVISEACSTLTYDVTVNFLFRFTEGGADKTFQILVDDNLVTSIPNNGDGLQEVTFPMNADGQAHTIKVVASDDPDCGDTYEYIAFPDPCPNIIQMPENGSSILNVCEGIFVDPGGIGGDFFSTEVETGNYPTCNCTAQQTLCSGTDAPISVDFRYIDIGGGITDHLIVYDGATNNNRILYHSGIEGENPSPSKITSSGTCLTFDFFSSNNFSSAGWEALISCGEGGFDACEDGFEGANQLAGNQTVNARFETNRRIVADQKIQAATEVTYNAGESITLLPGFEVAAGATFHALIEGCVEEIIVDNPATDARIKLPQEAVITTDPSVKVYPNPMTTEATIDLQLPQPQKIHLAIYDLNGRQISDVLTGQWLDKGQYTLNWYSESVEAGIYFLVLNGRPAQKLVVLR